MSLNALLLPQKFLPTTRAVSSRDRLVRDQDRNRKNDVINGFFDDLKKILGLKFAHKLAL